MEGPTGAGRRPEADATGGTRAFALLAVALLTVSTLWAGCLSGADDRDLDFSSYEEARAAEGIVYAPAEDGTSVRLKLIDPLDPGDVVEGQQRVILLLFDERRDAPQREANLRLEARHVEQDRGTSPEQNPRSEGNGVYEGFTTLDAAGSWTLRIEATLPGGESLTFKIPVEVGP